MFACLLIFSLSMIQDDGERVSQDPRGDMEAVLETASKEASLDEVGSILSRLLASEAAIRSAISTSALSDERIVFVLFGGNWGPRAKITWNERMRWQRILVESISAKPSLIRPVIRADRYGTYLRRTGPVGAATLNYFAFFEHAPYVDDLAEVFIESLRKAASKPAEPLITQGGHVLKTADEREVDLLGVWQILCGVCGRLDLIDNATSKNWRGRFPELDNWFNENRPYIVWNNKNSHIEIDKDSKELGRPTSRTSRAIPDLKPPWILVKESD